MLEAWGLWGCVTAELTALALLRATLYLFLSEAAQFFITALCERLIIFCGCCYSPRLHRRFLCGRNAALGKS